MNTLNIFICTFWLEMNNPIFTNLTSLESNGNA